MLIYKYKTYPSGGPCQPLYFIRIPVNEEENFIDLLEFAFAFKSAVPGIVSIRRSLAENIFSPKKLKTLTDPFICASVAFCTMQSTYGGNIYIMTETCYSVIMKTLANAADLRRNSTISYDMAVKRTVLGPYFPAFTSEFFNEEDLYIKLALLRDRITDGCSYDAVDIESWQFEGFRISTDAKNPFTFLKLPHEFKLSGLGYLWPRAKRVDLSSTKLLSTFTGDIRGGEKWLNASLPKL